MRLDGPGFVIVEVPVADVTGDVFGLCVGGPLPGNPLHLVFGQSGRAEGRSAFCVVSPQFWGVRNSQGVRALASLIDAVLAVRPHCCVRSDILAPTKDHTPVALTAVMRKLIVLANSLLKEDASGCLRSSARAPKHDGQPPRAVACPRRGSHFRADAGHPAAASAAPPPSRVALHPLWQGASRARP